MSGCTRTSRRPLDEEQFCLDTYGRTPAQYAEDLGWLGPDVWLAHCVHLSDEAVAQFAATGTGGGALPHAPTAASDPGIAPVRKLLDAGVGRGPGRGRQRVQRVGPR